jgi:hypothetical protein
MKRYDPDTGELFLPHRYRDGMYRVVDPALGKVKHHSKNQIPVATDEELIDYLRRGFHVRMRGVDSGQTNVIRPDEIDVTGVGSSETKHSQAKIRIFPTPAVVTGNVLGQSVLAVQLAKPAVGLLPLHGRINCQRCFGNQEMIWGETAVERDGWSIVNNPMSWGNQTPKFLVLGFSKGGNQNSSLLTRSHDEVAFSGGRPNLATILETLRLKMPNQSIDQMIADPEGEFAFGSLVRCTVKKRSGDGWLMSGKDIMSSCLRDQNMGQVISNCVSTFLGSLPSSVLLVVMLGNDRTYVDGCFSTIRSVRPKLRRINAVSYKDDEVTFVHAVHFKARGRVVPDWTNGVPGHASRSETDQPLKRELAIAAAAEALK